jgi:hypothetical protein
MKQHVSFTIFLYFLNIDKPYHLIDVSNYHIVLLAHANPTQTACKSV